MDPHVQEWLGLAVRWFHIITGVAWIGASFYFNWLENQLDRKGSHLREGVAGDLWAIHGGGFYFLEKFKVAPPKLPENLHWFKYEAYFTWISGVTLLAIVYYLNVDTQVIDSSVRDLTGPQAIGIGIGSMILGWVVYDQLCKSSLVKKPVLFSSLCIALAVVMAFFLCNMFGAKAAYIHVGAVLGTIMAANVFFVIIPSQKALVTAAENGAHLDPTLGTNAFRRSRHNNYITLPVLFIMISNHYPSTFGHSQNWAILAGVSIVGATIRHYFNIRHLPENKVWILPTAALGFILLAFVTAPAPKSEIKAGDVVPSTVEAASIIAKHCTSCHSKHPTDAVFSSAPNGVMFDEIKMIKGHKAGIRARAVSSESMPLGNKSTMTALERRKLGQWIDSLK